MVHIPENRRIRDTREKGGKRVLESDAKGFCLRYDQKQNLTWLTDTTLRDTDTVILAFFGHNWLKNEI